ncbi:unnamed protein product [Rotaria magnacalcarata]|uniref:Uncharacterized protein n=1 Tax=Rotaria magnacalcarata TaxID=392030 RepID=A0A816VSD8_9BILA|nr:unnamed protein product [Rotaria magnacalcarata]CAF1350647.1 unnamed protein product [Rotaria magnacalcarata]CAF2112201.1 unnamed protein product [Rotaria magnacalcarata]CAF2116912.1 unnamed protein product [Rotaria magnacalcarata]CAF3910962.1 unnamed protein product [Rotaria magnacalcarata]
MATNTTSKLFIRLSNPTQEQLNKVDFDYPLQCVFRRLQFDSTGHHLIFVDDRKINLQQNSLIGGLNIHLTELSHNIMRYRLEVQLTDGQQQKFKSIKPITLGCKGLLDNKPEHLNTLFMEKYEKK